MNQRHFIRRSPMELSSSELQGDRAAAQPSAEVKEEVAIRPELNLPTFSKINSNNNNQWELQHLRGESQDPLLDNSTTMMNSKRFSLLDVGRETVHLSRARSTFLAVLLATYTLVLLLQHVFVDYIIHTQPQGGHPQSWNERRLSCEKNILYPWRHAVIERNLSKAQQEDFFTLFQQNCSSIFKDPAEQVGLFSFKNGTLKFNSAAGFVMSDGLMAPHIGGVVLLQIFAWIWFDWAQVAVAWGLHMATTTTMSYYSRPFHRNPIHMPSQKLTDAIGEQFSYKVVLGLIRVFLTETLIMLLSSVVGFFIAMVRSVVVNKSLKLKPILDLIVQQSPFFWGLADPVPYLCLLSSVAAALEPGMWGFKALWRGIQLARGNRLKGYFIFLVLFLISWFDRYLSSLIALKPNQVMSESLLGMLRRSTMRWSFTTMGLLPGFFLVPVFYFLCKAWREKVATMA